MEAQVDSNGHIHEPRVRESLRTGAEVQGMLDQARADQVEAEGLKKDKEYNDALEKRASWVEFGVGVGVATGAAFLTPVAAAGVAGTLIPLGMETGAVTRGGDPRRRHRGLDRIQAEGQRR